MAQFSPTTDTTVTAAEPTLNVVASADAPLKVGKHVFQLVVQDDSGNNSAPATVTVIVADTQAPTAVIDFVDATGARNPAPQVTVPVNQAFTLDGSRSSDVDGSVKQWTWTLLAP